MMKAAAGLAQEIDMEFGVYLGDRYAPDEPPVDPSRLRMPEEWFVDWLDRLNLLAPPTVSE
jgi:hypothetical protein